jgi:hypothetical protein
LKHLFAPKGETTGVIKILMIVIFFMVGWLEIVSILFRPVSLSFRLFGNIYAGESILEAMSTMIPLLSWLLPIPFYFMELLVGVVQALVFMLLTAVFTMLIAQHTEGPSMRTVKIFGDLMKRLPKPVKEKYDVTTTCRNERKHSSVWRRWVLNGIGGPEWEWPRQSGEIPAPSLKFWCTEFSRSRLPKRSCFTRSIFCLIKRRTTPDGRRSAEL